MKVGVGLVILGLVIISSALAYALYAEMEIVEPEMTDTCTLEARVCPDGTTVGREGPHCEFAACPSSAASVPSHRFVFETVAPEEDPLLSEQTVVKLIYGDRAYHLGTHPGSCMALTESNWELLENEIDGAVCWFAGSGVELGLFEENGRLIVKQGLLEEGTPDAEGFRGDFIAIYTLP